MKHVNSMWFPDNDTHFERFTSIKGKYQIDVFKTGMMFDRRKSCFVDVGAHVGLWARQAFVNGYNEIHCFEPVTDNYACLLENNRDHRVPAKTYNVALGLYGTYIMESECGSNSGAWRYKWHEDKYTNKIHRLDDYNLSPTLIKIDTQGSECDVIYGAYDTIERSEPVIIVEQSQSHSAIALLSKAFEYKVMSRVRNDYIMAKERPCLD